MKKQRPFQLTEGDIEILTFVYQYRLVTIDHIVALTERPRRKINDRLVRLAERGYLYRKRFILKEHLPITHQKYVYTIHRNTTPILVERGIAPKETIDMRVRLHEIKPLFVKHSLMLTDLQVCFELASRTSPVKLVEWKEEGKEIKDSVTVVEKGERKKLPVQPDGFFVLEDTRQPRGRNRAYFFLEADRSTTTHKRFQRKIKGYHQYFEKGLHTKKYGIKSARVLTLTITQERARNLCEAAGEVLPASDKKFYYFAPIEHFSLDNPSQIFERILTTPRDFEQGRLYYLMPPVAAPIATA